MTWKTMELSGIQGVGWGAWRQELGNQGHKSGTVQGASGQWLQPAPAGLAEAHTQVCRAARPLGQVCRAARPLGFGQMLAGDLCSVFSPPRVIFQFTFPMCVGLSTVSCGSQSSASGLGLATTD